MNQANIDTFNQILTDVVANRKNLVNQLDTQRQQIEIGEAQVAKFDTLIASLQVTLDTPAILAAIEAQEAANALVSPTSAEPVVAEVTAEVAHEAAQQVPDSN